MIPDDIARMRRAEGYHRLAGVDEVGRGPLAGPVVACAVILPEGFDCDGIADSKAMTPKQRRVQAARLLEAAAIGLAFLPAPQIDALNIHRASLEAMRRAIAALPLPPDFVLADGRHVPPGLPCPAEAIVKGDSRVAAIAAASIIAKVMRDEMMEAAEARYPGYGFARSAGYPTPAHRAALPRLGLTPLHRLSFAPCREVREKAGETPHPKKGQSA